MGLCCGLLGLGACADPTHSASLDPDHAVSDRNTSSSAAAHSGAGAPAFGAPGPGGLSGGGEPSVDLGAPASPDVEPVDPSADVDPGEPIEPVVPATTSRPGMWWANAAASALKDAAGFDVRINIRMSARLTWLQVDLYDQQYPLRVDILANNVQSPRRVVYMLPGGGANFTNSFLTQPEGGLANFYRRHDYLVIGVTPREDSVPNDTQDFSFMAGWGMKQRREDLRAVIQKVQSVMPIPYELAGHSYGAAAALDYASAYPDEPRRVVALDIYSIDPDADPTGIGRARRTRDAFIELMDDGVYADTSYTDFGPLTKSGLGDEKIPGESALDRYTSEQLMLFGLVYSSVLPGIHTPITGLPGDWPMASSNAAGEYFSGGFNPEDDKRLLRRISFATLRMAAAAFGSGLVAMAFARDYWSVVALGDGYQLPWDRIRARVIWLNSELGYADQMYGARLMREAGNTRVGTAVIPDYGHMDMTLGNAALEDVWSRLFRH